jgi:hypothetical protein
MSIGKALNIMMIVVLFKEYKYYVIFTEAMT